jgi:hypothetical protein
VELELEEQELEDNQLWEEQLVEHLVSRSDLGETLSRAREEATPEHNNSQI